MELLADEEWQVAEAAAGNPSLPRAVMLRLMPRAWGVGRKMVPMCAFFDSPEPRRVSPGEYPVWDEALALLNRDLAATLPEQAPLRLVALPAHGEDEPERVHVALDNGQWHGNWLDPESADDPDLALGSVADAAQETVAERLWQAWPVCAEHGFGMHLRDVDGELSWWCAGERSRRGPAHVRATVGALGVSELP